MEIREPPGLAGGLSPRWMVAWDQGSRMALYCRASAGLHGSYPARLAALACTLHRPRPGPSSRHSRFGRRFSRFRPVPVASHRVQLQSAFHRRIRHWLWHVREPCVENTCRNSGLVPALCPVLATGPAGPGAVAGRLAARLAVPFGGHHLCRAVRVAASDPVPAGACAWLASAAGASRDSSLGSKPATLSPCGARRVCKAERVPKCMPPNALVGDG